MHFMSSFMNYLFKKLDIKKKHWHPTIINYYEWNMELSHYQQF